MMIYLKKFNESVNDFYQTITPDEFHLQTEDDSNYCPMSPDVLDRIFDEFPKMEVDEEEDDSLEVYQGRFRFFIIQSKDEWFFVKSFDSVGTCSLYKCDQLDGLIKLMSDKLPPYFLIQNLKNSKKS